MKRTDKIYSAFFIAAILYALLSVGLAVSNAANTAKFDYAHPVYECKTDGTIETLYAPIK